MNDELEKDVTADDWAAAMAEQETTEQSGGADDWAAAMAEQAAVESAAQPEVQKAQIFQSLAPDGGQSAANNLDLILDIPVHLTVELGRTPDLFTTGEIRPGDCGIQLHSGGQSKGRSGAVLFGGC